MICVVKIKRTRIGCVSFFTTFAGGSHNASVKKDSWPTRLGCVFSPLPPE